MIEFNSDPTGSPSISVTEAIVTICDSHLKSSQSTPVDCILVNAIRSVVVSNRSDAVHSTLNLLFFAYGLLEFLTFLQF